MDGRGFDESVADAFGAVANGTRFDIVEALWAAEREGATPVAFSELRERTGVADSGQFNYHLDRLVGRFVRSTEAGYELTYAGKRIVGAVVSGAYSDTDVSLDPRPVGECPVCGGVVEASYADGYMEVACTAENCGVVVTDGLPAPPVLADDHDPETLPAVFNRLLVTDVQATGRGFCRLCGGPATLSVERSDAGALDADTREALGLEPGEELLGVESRCRACGASSHGAVGTAVIGHPAVVGYLYEAGIDYRETPIWEMDWLFEPTSTVTNEDPLRVRTTVDADGAEGVLELTLDADLTVLDHARRPSG